MIYSRRALWKLVFSVNPSNLTSLAMPRRHINPNQSRLDFSITTVAQLFTEKPDRALFHPRGESSVVHTFKTKIFGDPVFLFGFFCTLLDTALIS